MNDDEFDPEGLQLFLPEAMAAFETVTRKSPLPPLLFHYTTAEGLLGILKSEVIWATNGRYMNDMTELAYGRELINRTVSEARDLAAAPVKMWLADFVGMLDRVYEEAETYVACFCAEGDLLSQWRAYGSGRGFSLAFSAPRLSNFDGLALLRVEYDPAIQKAAIEHTIRLHVSAFATAVADRNARRMQEVSGALGLMLALWVVALKHPSFAEEREWRLCPLVPLQSVFVRSDRGWLRPYIEIALKELATDRMPLSGVRHGPSPHPDLEKRTLRLLLKDTKYSDVSVSGSDVPLRVGVGA